MTTMLQTPLLNHRFFVPASGNTYTSLPGAFFLAADADVAALEAQGCTVAGGSGDSNPNLGEIAKGFDNGSSVIATGQVVGYTVVPYAGTITGWVLIGNASGSIVIDVWKVASGSIPTSANSITASAKPTLSSAQQATSTNLTGWTTAVAAGDVFAFSVTSASTLTHADLTLLITKS